MVTPRWLFRAPQIPTLQRTVEASAANRDTRRMPDRDDLGGAWRVPPSRYLAGRPAEFSVGAPDLRLRDDGRRLPAGASTSSCPTATRRRRWPTVLILTPYVRRFELGGGQQHRAVAQQLSLPRHVRAARLCAWSWSMRAAPAPRFGTRDSFRSPRERADYKRDRRLDRGPAMERRRGSAPPASPISARPAISSPAPATRR